MKNKIIFTKKISQVGKAKQKLIYIPVSVARLVQVEKEYKITLEELPEDPLVPTEIVAIHSKLSEIKEGK